MPSENNPEVQYELFEDKKAIKFMDSHSDDEKLIKRIYGKYHQLSIDPYNEAESSFKSRKCPKCKKTRVGDYRIIYFINESTKEVEIIDIGPRRSIYKKWDWFFKSRLDSLVSRTRNCLNFLVLFFFF